MRRALLATLLAPLLLLAACSGSAPSTATSSPPASAPALSQGAYPVTVPTAFGDVEIDEFPRRVVALGWGDAESALVLGVQPVGASDWLDYGGDGVGPWLKGAYTSAPTIVETSEVDLEAVAALRPDLILDTSSNGTQERHDQLRQVAPVLGPPEGVISFGTTWQQQLDMLGAALGRSQEAERITARTEQTLARASQENPRLRGATFTVGAYSTDGYSAYVSGDRRVDLLAELGLENQPRIDALATGNFYVPISRERLTLFDADVTVFFPIGRPASDLTSDPFFRAIPSVRSGHVVVLADESPLVKAFSSATAPGVAYAAERIAPLLDRALEGEGTPAPPATDAAP